METARMNNLFPAWMPAVILLAEFLVLALLGWLLLRLIDWESRFQDRRAGLLRQLRESATRLRGLRRQLQNASEGLPGLELNPANRRKLALARWAGKALFGRNTARS